MGKLHIYWYGVLFGCAYIVPALLAAWRAWMEDVPVATILDFARYLFLFGVLGGKLAFALTDWSAFIAGFQFEGLASLKEGWVFYGGALCAAGGAYLVARARKIEYWRPMDFLTSAAPLGHAIGRIGCFLAGCCYGTPTGLPWAVRFPPAHPTHGIPVHPTQLYEVAGNLALFGALTWMLPRRRFKGQIFCWYVIGYAVLRFFVEDVRADNPHRWPGALTDSQFVAIFCIAAAIPLMRRLRGASYGHDTP